MTYSQRELQLIYSFIEMTSCSLQQALKYLYRHQTLQGALDEFYETGEEPENTKRIEQMMDSTTTSREQAIKFLMYSEDNVELAINLFMDSGEEPKGTVKDNVKPKQESYQQQTMQYNQQNTNNYNEYNVEDQNYNYNRQKHIKNPQVSKGTDLAVKFSETMHVDIKIAQEYLSKANNDYSIAVQHYKQEQAQSDQNSYYSEDSESSKQKQNIDQNIRGSGELSNQNAQTTVQQKQNTYQNQNESVQLKFVVLSAQNALQYSYGRWNCFFLFTM
ncbi:UBA-like_superfamily [Hexamita inflata]|uniref:UBA-like superfamily n=1 Tax=Hexamita inflata TaxID=28002 RepID=A0AA86NDV4_9EUKA|nr:UBA-like superfamily [Hexamita inflata]